MRSALLALLVLCGCGSREPARRTPPQPRATAEPDDAPEAPATPEVTEPAPAPPPPDATTLAEGRALVATGPDGFLSSLRVWAVGPLEPEVERALGDCPNADEAPADPPPGCADARWTAEADHRVDLSELVPDRHDVVYLGVRLLNPAPTAVTVMVGMRGAAAILVDGEVLGEAESADRFRGDRVAVRAPLTTGEHRLIVRFTRPEAGRWRGAIRLLSETSWPGVGNVALSIDRPPSERLSAMTTAAVRLEEAHALGASGPELRVVASLPGGGPRVPVALTLAGERHVLEAERGVFEGDVTYTVEMPARGNLDIECAIGDRTERFGRRLAPDRSALEAAASLRDRLEDAPADSRAPIEWRMRELLRVVAEDDGDARWRRVLLGEARRIRAALDRGDDPFGRLRGYERMAFYSRLDGTPQHYELFVPPGYRAARQWPLLVTLHGYKGNAGDYFRNTFGLARDYEGHETLQAHGRYGEAPRSGPMIVIGPDGRGQSFYRHAGEVDIFEALADATRRFNVDPNRVYITGGSMGGTGAAYVPYRNPDVFAASAALAGYHDQRLRSDTDHAALSAAERFMEGHRSDVDWAANGMHLPMLLVRGTRDRPVSWTRSLVERLDTLQRAAGAGYRHEHREPELGHNVWTETYADGAIFRYLGRYRRPTMPRRVVLRTARERTRRSFWVTVEAREAPDRFAHIDARVRDGVVEASIEGARAVTFAPGPPLREEGAPVRVRVGQTELSGPSPLTVERVDDAWRVSTSSWPAEGERSVGVDGPIRDVFHEPLLFVVGTQAAAYTYLNRRVAEHWAHPHGWIVDYPIVDDDDVTDEMIAAHTLVLIGPPESNSVHARIVDDLPIEARASHIALGEARHEGDGLGAVFVARNPLAPTRSVLVISGTSPLGVWRSTQLPDLLPDYVVFDGSVTHSRDRFACGGTGCEYLAHGFFDMRMRL